MIKLKKILPLKTVYKGVDDNWYIVTDFNPTDPCRLLFDNFHDKMILYTWIVTSEKIKDGYVSFLQSIDDYDFFVDKSKYADMVKQYLESYYGCNIVRLKSITLPKKEEDYDLGRI